MAEIKIRKIEKNPEYVGDPDLSEYLIDIEITNKDNTREVQMISITALNENSLKIMLPDVLLDYMLQKSAKISLPDVILDKKKFTFNETKGELT